ncbi:response regulator [Nostocales cyanobacterium HT-58-2]|nr:response regulator [Nostocales cyanobacterium HT-58-2]
MVKNITKKVLYIDDEPEMQLIVKTCLQTLGGWEVEVAKSGTEGLVKAEELKPDAIILDVMMPGMDGVACLQQLQVNVKTQTIPVIFLTSKWSLTERCRFSALGAVGAIAKPFDPLTLVPQIAKVLGWKLENSNTLN